MRVKMICMANAKHGNGMLRSLIGLYYRDGLAEIDQPRWIWASVDGKRRGIESGLVADLGPGDVLEFDVLDLDREEACGGLVRIDPFSIKVQGTLSPKELSRFLVVNGCFERREDPLGSYGLYVEQGKEADALSLELDREGRVTALQLGYSQSRGDGKRRVEGPVWDPRFMELMEVVPEALKDVESLLLVRLGSSGPPMPSLPDPILAVLI